MNDSVIDFEHLGRFTAGDAGVEAEVLGLFAHQVELWLAALEPSAEDETWKTAAHTLKGAARGVGAHALAAACEAAEMLIGDAASPVARSVAAGDVRAAAYPAMECALAARSLRLARRAS